MTVAELIQKNPGMVDSMAQQICAQLGNCTPREVEFVQSKTREMVQQNWAKLAHVPVDHRFDAIWAMTRDKGASMCFPLIVEDRKKLGLRWQW